MEEAIRFYFKKDYDYNTIIDFLEKFHDICISKRTLLNRLKDYGLRRRGCDVNVDEIRVFVQRELDGSGRLLGYRAMWKRIRSKYGVQVPRLTIQKLLKDLDPEGSNLRKAHRLKRRDYLNPGPNFCWHTDVYDKLKPFGFPIHGCIDGFSRRIMWLVITRTNNDPRVIGNFFLDCIKTLGGTPRLLRTDRGTENGVMASAQCFLRRNDEGSLSGIQAHRYGSSHSNQRIEAWWAMLRRSCTSWWIDYFKNLVDKGLLDTSCELHLECLWFCFNTVLQKELDDMKDSWNHHYVRASRCHTAHGIPEKLYYLPESVGAIDHKQPFMQSDIQEIENESSLPLQDELSTKYQQYFLYALNELQLAQPQNWRDAQALYEQLIVIAQ